MLHHRQWSAIVFSVLVALGAAGVRPAATAAGDLTVDAAEREMVRLLNIERARYGLVQLRVDPRLGAIARQRSTDMARLGYFSHTQPDGHDVYDLLNANTVTWRAAGEIIAWNTAPTLAESAPLARTGWMNSSGHRAIVLSRDFNYFGIGLAIDPKNGRKLWTGVFIKGPDRTGGWARFGTAPSTTMSAATRYRDVAVSWRGGDIRLQTLTAGFRHFGLRIRTDGGAWRTLSSATTTTSRTVRVWRGHVYEVQVRACDLAGNCGYWLTQTLKG